MSPAARERWRVRSPLLLVAAFSWVALLCLPRITPTSVWCAALMSQPKQLAAMFVPLSLGWVLMLAAMMGPLLTLPLRHVRDRSFTRRRTRATALFLKGYAAIWIAAGVLLSVSALVLNRIAQDAFLRLAIGGVIGLLWQFSPFKERCLNNCHALTELSAFGAAADRDALRFGLSHGIWCAGSCWAIMWFAMLPPRGHLIAMAVATLWIFSERLNRTASRWDWRGPVRPFRIVIAQTRLLFVRN